MAIPARAVDRACSGPRSGCYAWLIAAAWLLSACSFGLQGLDPKWDGSYEPRCDGSTVVLDRVVGASFLAVGTGLISANRDSDGVLAGAVSLGIGIVYQIAASVGSGAVTKCETARTRWRFSNAIKARAPKRAATRTAPAAPTAAPSSDTAHPEPRPWAAGVSAAEQAVALEIYRSGNQEFIQAHYAQALARYKQAIRHWDHPAIRFNMAICQIELDQPADARDNLERSLAYGASALGGDALAQALRYRRLLETRLVRLTLDCPEPDEEVMLDGELVFRGPGVVDRYVLPGEHQVVATKPGFLPASKKVVLSAGQPATYQIRPLVDPRPVH